MANEELERLQELRERIDDLKHSASKTEGVVEQNLALLRRKYKCKTVKEARKLLKQTNTKAETARTKFATLLDKLEDGQNGDE